MEWLTKLDSLGLGLLVLLTAGVLTHPSCPPGQYCLADITCLLPENETVY